MTLDDYKPVYPFNKLAKADWIVEHVYGERYYVRDRNIDYNVLSDPLKPGAKFATKEFAELLANHWNKNNIT